MIENHVVMCVDVLKESPVLSARSLCKDSETGEFSAAGWLHKCSTKVTAVSLHFPLLCCQRQDLGWQLCLEIVKRCCILLFKEAFLFVLSIWRWETFCTFMRDFKLRGGEKKIVPVSTNREKESTNEIFVAYLARNILCRFSTKYSLQV